MQTNSLTIRQSGFELMRIFAILMIIAHHLSLHGVLNVGVYDSGNAINKLITQLYFPGGETGVGLFFMITGYFLVKSDRKSNYIKLLLQVLFYGITLAVIALYIYKEREFKFEILEIVKCVLVPISSLRWWFVSYYVLLLLMVPQLNVFVRRLNRKGFLLMLLILCVLEYMMQWIFVTQFLRISMAVFFYCLGAYLSVFEFKIRKITCVLLFVMSWSFYALLQYYKIPFSFLIGKLNVVLCCITAFMFFKQLNIHSNMINLVAKTTLGIYMIHDNDVLRSFIWNDVFKMTIQFSFEYYWLTSICTILSVFFIGMLLDFLRLKLLEPHYLKTADSLCTKISNFIYNK